MPTPKLWSKLEDAGDVTSPQLGTGGAEVGSPTYVAAKFNNGILSDAIEGCTFPTGANSINLDKGTIEFWAKLNYDPTDGAYHYLVDFYDGTNGGIRLLFNHTIDDFHVLVYSGGILKVNEVTVGVSWSSGDLLHFGLTWDREGNDIGGGKTASLKINDVEELSSAYLWDADTVLANLHVGHDQSGTLFSLAVIDNLKTYDVVKTDFSDKEDEDAGAPPPPSAKTLVQAALISAIPLIAIPTLGQIAKFAGG